MREYIGIVTQLWGKQISGPVLAGVSLCLAAIGLSIHDAPKAAFAFHVGTWLTLAVATVMVFAAQYDAWALERLRYECEHARYQKEALANVRPEIQGEVSGFHLDRMHGKTTDGGRRSSSFVDCVCDVYLCNVRPATTNLKAIFLDGSMLTPPVEFSVAQLLAPPSELVKGIGHSFQIAAGATVQGSAMRDLMSLDLANLKVRVIDAFGGEHVIQVRAGERLEWPS
jgi:hypothetical protein